jgi:copper resistance protein B
MRKKLLTIALSGLIGGGLVNVANAADDGKSDLNAVIPQGDVDRASGAPAGWKKPVTDERIYQFSLLDRFEYHDGNDGSKSYVWSGQGWIGGDINKFWWKAEGEGGVNNGESPESTEFQALYNRTIAPFWGVQAGIRYDVNPNPDRAFGVLGIQGLAPYRLGSDTSLYVSEDGDVSFRGELEYDQRLTQRLILQPRLEINASAQDVPEYGLGEGLNNTEMGLRLRYEIWREFAPYIGVSYAQKYGDTKDYALRAGESSSSTAFVVGIRAWY